MSYSELGKGAAQFLGGIAAFIALMGFTVGYLIGEGKVKSATFEYSALDDYYLECLSYHDGTGKVLIRTDGTYELSCADGTTFKGGE